MGLEDQLRNIEDQRSSMAAQAQQHSARLADRTVMANQLLSQLASETLVVLRRRSFPQALEIVSASVSAPFKHGPRTTHLQLGRVITLLHPKPPYHYMGRPYGITDDGVFVRYFDAFEAFRSKVTETRHGSVKARQDQERACAKLAAAAKQAGCVRTVATLLPQTAHGESDDELNGWPDRGTFYLGDNGRLMVGHRSAEEWVAEQIAH